MSELCPNQGEPPPAAGEVGDGPAVPEDREPASVVGEPSDEELLATLNRAVADFPPRHPDAEALNAVEYPLALELRKARAAIAADRARRAATAPAGERQATPVPVAVSDALIKAECSLSDIAEGEETIAAPNTFEWAEQRCAETLAIIRPVMKQHRIRTSEWPPQPLPQAGENDWCGDHKLNENWQHS